jgi:hypothetical protein
VRRTLPAAVTAASLAALSLPGFALAATTPSACGACAARAATVSGARVLTVRPGSSDR